VKFVDESHFVPKDLNSSNVLGLVGERVRVVELDNIHQSVHVTLFTSLTRRPVPFSVETHESMNTARSFLAAVRNAINSGLFVHGDFLILDGARVHFSMETIDELMEILRAAGVTPILLPPYSPELNPCELCFNVVKNLLRTSAHRRPRNSDLARHIVEALIATVSVENLMSFYIHSVIFRGERQ